MKMFFINLDTVIGKHEQDIALVHED